MTKMKNEGNQKEFGKMLKRINPKKREASGITHTAFKKHFQSILSTSSCAHIPGDNGVGPLDHNITKEELMIASRKLKPGKATGIDNISDEMVLCLMASFPDIILKLFNSIMHTNRIIPEWVLGIIVPIHKKGSKTDPLNYRGITLMSCLGKLFLTILNSRLIQYSKDEKLLTDTQLGFVSGNRTSDAHIIINNLVRKYCHKNGKKIFGCFVDFSMAFDTIPRDILLDRIRNYGITGRFFNIIKGIYEMDESCVKLGNKYTSSFGINLGVRQGCVLSPILFNLFMADLAKKLEMADGKVKVNNTEISSVFWADDIILLSESEQGLNTMIKILEKYSNEHKLKINTDKTKVMIFNKTGRLMKRLYHINGVQLENVRSYKYLGFLLTPSGEITSGLQDLRDRALKAFMGLKTSLGLSFHKDIETTLNLVDAMVKPILLYNSDFWGCMKMPTNNPIESLHMLMCKQLLGVQKCTTNVGVLLEIGRVPLNLYAKKLAIKNWERIRKNMANRFLIESYKESVENKFTWSQDIKKMLEENGMLNLFLNNNYERPIFVHKRLFQTLCDQFHQNAFETIRNVGSKLRTYAIFKKQQGFETYLSHIKNFKFRRMLTKLRLSNHDLFIETGRHKKGMWRKKEMRICPLCHGDIEDEVHLLFQCPTYNTLREELFRSLDLPINFQYYLNDEKLEFLTKDLKTDLAKYIYNCFELRAFLLHNPKRRV